MSWRGAGNRGILREGCLALSFSAGQPLAAENLTHTLGSLQTPTGQLGMVPVSKGPPQAPCQILIHPHHVLCIADVSRETTAPEIRHVGSHPESPTF